MGTVENFDEVYDHAKGMVEAEIEKVGDKFDMEALEAEVGVRMDKDSLKEATIKDGKVDTEALKEGCYKVEAHFKELQDKEKEGKKDKKGGKKNKKGGKKNKKGGKKGGKK